MFVVVTLYGEWTLPLQQAQHVLFMVSGVFYYFNSILNPILYTIMSKRFRRGFHDIWGSCKLLKVVRNSEDSSQKLQEFNMLNVAKNEPRCFKPMVENKRRGESELVPCSRLLLHHSSPDQMTSHSECGLGQARLCLVITDKSNSEPAGGHCEPAGGHCSHLHHAGEILNHWQTRIIVNNRGQVAE